MPASNPESGRPTIGPVCNPAPWLRPILRFAAEVRPLASSWAFWLPLLGFVLPTVAIGYGIVMPRHGILGEPELTLGFGSTVVGACLTYLAGARVAWSIGVQSAARTRR